MKSNKSDLKADFIGYHIFIKIFDGDIDKWKKHLREKGSMNQVTEDYQFILWLEKELKKDPDLINRIRQMVSESDLKGVNESKIGDKRKSEGILFECVKDEARLYLQDPAPDVGFYYEMPKEFWEMLIKRYKEISEDHNFTPGQQADAKYLTKIMIEGLEEMEK